MQETLSEKLRLKALKELVLKKLPTGSLVRGLILSEPDEIPRDEYVVKFKIWATLLNKELAQRG